MAGTILGAVAAPLIGGAVSSIFGGGSKPSSGASQGAAAADPFASQRPQYQQQLSDLMSGKTPFQETAGAKALTETGMNAESAQMAQRGLSNSGAEKAALTKYATGIASQDYNQQMGNLMTLSGAQSGSPGAAGGIIADSSQQQAQGLNTFGNTVGTAVAGSPTFQGWMNGTTSGDTTGPATGGGMPNQAFGGTTF